MLPGLESQRHPVTQEAPGAIVISLEKTSESVLRSRVTPQIMEQDGGLSHASSAECYSLLYPAWLNLLSWMTWLAKPGMARSEKDLCLPPFLHREVEDREEVGW